MTQEFTKHCGFCDRDIISVIGPPAMYVVTVKPEDGTNPLGRLDATYSGVCLSCATNVIAGIGTRHYV